MADFLVFQLQGALASWGDVAVGEFRGTRDDPGAAALVGLLGAALGIDRGDDAAHAALRDGYAWAVGTLGGGTLLRDYHTTQVPGRADMKHRPHRTRRDELSLPKPVLNTGRHRRRQRGAACTWALDRFAAAARDTRRLDRRGDECRIARPAGATPTLVLRRPPRP